MVVLMRVTMSAGEVAMLLLLIVIFKVKKKFLN